MPKTRVGMGHLVAVVEQTGVAKKKFHGGGEERRVHSDSLY